MMNAANGPLLASAQVGPLADLLSQSGGVTLTDEQRRLVLAGLQAAGADALLVLAQRRLLALHDESASRVRSIAEGAVRTIRERLEQPDPAASFDHVTADEARRALAADIEQARSGRAVLEAVLTFARAIAVMG